MKTGISLHALEDYRPDSAASPSSTSPSSSNAAGKPRSVSRRAMPYVLARGVPLTPPADWQQKLFRDPPEKLSAKLYETDLRKPARMGAQRDMTGAGVTKGAWGVVFFCRVTKILPKEAT